MAYWEWGDPANGRVLLCVHGLTRTGRDFDTLARRLCGTYRVVCPDVVGRGASDWLVDAAGYVVPQYVADMLTLIARAHPSRLDWVGTSMGGLIALALLGAYAQARVARPETVVRGLDPALGIPFGRIVLNDIGPDLDPDGVARIADYVGQPVAFGSFDQAVDYVRDISPGFGPHTRAQWETLARHVMVRHDSQWVKHYDLRIAQPFSLQDAAALKASEAILWSSYESIPVPLLILRGEQSDLLSADSAARMLARNSAARLQVVAGVGHAPTLMADIQIEPIERFLLADDQS